MVDLRKFWTMCRLHDWTYEWSDDPEAYRNGKESEANLLRYCFISGDYAAIYNAWADYHFHSGPKPKEPSMED